MADWTAVQMEAARKKLDHAAQNRNDDDHEMAFEASFLILITKQLRQCMINILVSTKYYLRPKNVSFTRQFVVRVIDGWRRRPIETYRHERQLESSHTSGLDRFSSKYIQFSVFASLSCIFTKVFVLEIYLQSTLNWISLRLELLKARRRNKLLTDFLNSWVRI